MRIATFTIVLLLIIIFLAMSVASTLVVNRYISPKYSFYYLLAGTIISSVMSLGIDVDIPN